MRNDREDFATRLYDRLPAVYRTSDGDGSGRGGPLYELLYAIAGQVAAIRQDLDDLWDDFFIETCDDWVVPYLAGLFGTNLVANPVGQSNRRDVSSTVLWRRSKGTPAMLAGLATATTGWPTDVAEFFRTLGWNQNVNHVSSQRLLTVPLTDPFPLSRLGLADDATAHTADIRAAKDLDQARLITAAPAGESLVAPGWETPGRQAITNVGFFVRRLKTFAMRGVTPAAGAPDAVPAADARSYTFDPLNRELPLYSQSSGEPILREAFAHSPGSFFGAGADICVRSHGVPFAVADGPGTEAGASRTPFTFGDPPGSARLHATEGIVALEPRLLAGAPHFAITALWQSDSGQVRLGALSTLLLRRGQAALALDQPVGAAGRLILRIAPGGPDPGLGWGALPLSPPGRFPATVLAIRDDQPTGARYDGSTAAPDGSYANALLVYVPETFVSAADPLELDVSDDGSTWSGNPTAGAPLARASQGQAFPPADVSRPSTVPAELTSGLHRRSGLLLPDEGRLAGVPGLEIQLWVAADGPQLAGGVVTAARAIDDDVRRLYAVASGVPEWTAFSFLASLDAVSDALPIGTPTLSALHVALIDPSILAGETVVIPQHEIVVGERSGDALLVYVPELTLTGAAPEIWLALASDGSTYRLPQAPGGAADPESLPDGANLARAAAGQVIALEGAYPLRRRVVVAGRPRSCELGIDPELGRFCLSQDDPQLALSPDQRHLSVDYADAFADGIGAHAFDRGVDEQSQPATRVVSASGDAAAPLPFWRMHASISDALAAASDGEVIEVADSATYLETVTIDLSSPATFASVTIRAGASPQFQRPCLVATGETAVLAHGDPAGSEPAASSLELNGLLIGPGGLMLDSGGVGQINLVACTLAPRAADGASLVTAEPDPSHPTQLLLCRCIVGAIRLAAAVDRIVVADSIVAARGGLAIGGPVAGTDIGSDTAADAVQLERTTVLGRVRCDTLVASESLLNDIAAVDDRQSGCIRFSRYEPGSVLPRRYRCVPADDAPSAEAARPSFVSLDPVRPGFAQLGAGCSPLVLSASQAGDQAGAFASAYPTLRLANLHTKLTEFMPVGLTPVVIADT